MKNGEDSIHASLALSCEDREAVSSRPQLKHSPTK